MMKLTFVFIGLISMNAFGAYSGTQSGNVCHIKSSGKAYSCDEPFVTCGLENHLCSSTQQSVAPSRNIGVTAIPLKKDSVRLKR